MKPEKNASGDKTLNNTQKILILGIILIIIIMITAIILIYKAVSTPQPPPQTGEAESGGNLVLDESNLDSIEDQLAQKVEEGMFEVNMNTIWHFKEGERTSNNAYVANGASNKYPFTFEILLDETEVIYTSTLVPVGKQLKEITLDRDLPKGIYETVCMYHLWAEDGTEKSIVGVNVTLSIE